MFYLIYQLSLDEFDCIIIYLYLDNFLIQISYLYPDKKIYLSLTLIECEVRVQLFHFSVDVILSTWCSKNPQLQQYLFVELVSAYH